MIKKVPCLIFIALLFSKLALPQKMATGKLFDLLQATPANNALSADSTYYLIELKAPVKIKYNKYKIIRQLDYHHYIIDAKNLPAGADILNVSKANNLWKADDNLLLLLQKHHTGNKNIALTITNGHKNVSTALQSYGKVLSQSNNRVSINMAVDKLPQLLQLPYIIFAGEIRTPHEELVINDIDLGANNIAAITNNFPGIDGTGINVAIKENRYDNDLDILNRSFSSFPAANFTTGHATTMATLIGGNGNSFIKGLGAAPQVRFTSSDFANLSPDSTAIFKTYHIGLENHSYGTGIENYYGTEAMAYDQQVYNNDSIIHVFSSGNIGTTAPETGVYNGIASMANLSGTFKQAKNVIVIGGTGRDNTAQALSSAGPAYDGRIKPELVADGEDGTSGAAALVSGAVALLQQAYQKQYHQLPPVALIKSLLINSADDIGVPEVDYKTGYGKLNALEAMRTLQDKRWLSGSVASQEQQDYIITVPPNCKQLKVSLAWTDPPAALNAPVALMNDLDLSVTAVDNKILYPWVLNSFPAVDSLNSPAYRKRDSLNNTEQVTLQNPTPGNYTIHVKGYHVDFSKQVFYVAYQETAANKFEWTYPSGHEQLFAADENYLRWQSSYSVATGKLSISYDHGKTWQQLTDVNLKDNFYNWIAPDVFATAMLKMDIDNQAYISSEFSISKPLTMNVGYNCTDGILLHWNAQSGAIGYAVYAIKNNLLTKLTTSADTTVIIPAAQQPSAFFAVSAQGNGFEGIKSYTVDITNQGVGCYVKVLLANVVNNSVALDLSLGSVYNLKTITWEKLMTPGTYAEIGSATITAATDYQFIDLKPKAGTQYYKAKLTTADGKIVYSDIANATFLQGSQFVVYPNPVSNGQVNVLSGDINNYQLKLYDTNGRLNFTQNLNNLQNTVQLSVGPGVYVYVIELNGKVVSRGKLIKI